MTCFETYFILEIVPVCINDFLRASISDCCVSSLKKAVTCGLDSKYLMTTDEPKTIKEKTEIHKKVSIIIQIAVIA